MLDAKKILDQFLGSGSSAPGRGGLGDAVGGALSKLGGTGGAPTRTGGSGDLASQIGGLAKGNMGGIAGGAIAGTLASVLLGGKGVGKIGGGAVKLGGLAILGGLAYKAWQNYQEKQQPAAAPGAPAPSAPVQIAPPPSDAAFTPSTPADEQKLGLLLIRAMIAAARSDGKIDKDEIAKIREALKAAGAEASEQDFLLEQLGQPDDLDAIATEAQAQGPELASEVWLAARLTIDPDTPGEKHFLQALGSKLRLDATHLAHLEATAAQAKQSGVAVA